MSWESLIKREILETIVIGENENIRSFAKKVAEVLERDYGEHNYETFFRKFRFS